MQIATINSPGMSSDWRERTSTEFDDADVPSGDPSPGNAAAREAQGRFHASWRPGCQLLMDRWPSGSTAPSPSANATGTAYEFNNAYRAQFEAAGFCISGTTPDNQLVEIIEIPAHPFFVASQFHPEF